MRKAGAILNLLLAACFAAMAAYLFRRGETAWAVGAVVGTVLNVALALVKLRARSGEEQP